MKFLFPCLFIAGLALQACSTSTGNSVNFLSKPQDLVVSSKKITLANRVTKLAYGVDEFYGAVSVIDLESRNYKDTDEGDDEDNRTPIIVGGKPTSLALDDRGEKTHLFVADAQSKAIWGFEITPTVTESDYTLDYSVLPLGTTKVAAATEPLFLDKGRTSSPSIEDISVDKDGPAHEWFKLNYKGDDKFNIEASKSGDLPDEVLLNKSYTSSKGGLGFTVRSGADRADSSDEFWIGVVRGKPLPLDCVPKDLQVDDNFLYILCEDDPKLIKFNLDTLTVDATLDLADGSGDPQVFGKMVLRSGKLWIPQTTSTTSLKVNLNTFTSSDLALTYAIDAIEVDSTGDLWVHPLGEQLWVVLNGTDLSVEKEIFTLRNPARGLIASTPQGEYLLSTSLEGEIEVLSVKNLELLDTEPKTGDSVKSTAIQIEFLDTGATSSPDLVSIDTVDGLTRTERWQLVFQGTLPGFTKRAAVITGDMVTFTGSPTTDTLKVGDSVSVGNDTLTVKDIVDDSTVQLKETPTKQGSATVTISASNSEYVIYGSLSGLQKKRCAENTVCTSDNSEIKLTIRSSIVNATTAGDYYTFMTISSISPIDVGSSKLATPIVYYETPGDSTPRALVGFKDGTGLGFFSLTEWEEKKNLR